MDIRGRFKGERQTRALMPESAGRCLGQAKEGRGPFEQALDPMAMKAETICASPVRHMVAGSR